MLQEGEVALGSPALYDASSIVHRFHIRKSSGSRHLYYNGKKVKKDCSSCMLMHIGHGIHQTVYT